MAEVKVDSAVEECGFCLCKTETLTDPKALPCSHVHCLQCLRGFYEENNVVVCAASECGAVFEGSPDTLPPYDVVEGDKKLCDVCVSKKVPTQQAVIYCTVCCKTFCTRHQEFHDEVLDNHKKISIEEFGGQAMEKQTKNCTEHVDHPYIMGCKLCMTVACVKCIPRLDKCDKGTTHSLLPLDDLVAALVDDDICAEMMAREDQYEKLFKDASKAKTEFDDETTEMVQLIHHTRDVQIDALKLKYKELEDEMVERRQKTRRDMAEFMEDVVLTKWTHLRNSRRLIECRVKRSPQVDIVKGYKQLKEELPKLWLRDQFILKQLGENQQMELKVALSDDIIIGSEPGSPTLMSLPKSMTPVNAIKLPSLVYSVCHHAGSTYVGLENGTITKIDNNYQIHNSFISTSDTVESISVYKDRFYTFSRSDPRTVNVFDISGGHITSWKHPYHLNQSNMLTLVADQVVIADPPNQRITVYSLTGEILRHIPCPLLTDSHIQMCAVDDTSVVLSNFCASKVYRVSLSSGEVMWTCSGVKSPLALTSYGQYILSSAQLSKAIYILDNGTGELVGKLVDDGIPDTAFGLEVYNTTLVIANCNDNVHFYKLQAK